MAPNSATLPKRCAGMLLRRRSTKEAKGSPTRSDAAWWLAFKRSVSNEPGSRLFMVTPRAASELRAAPATKPVRPLRAPLDRPSESIGAFTLLEVMLMMRP